MFECSLKVERRLRKNLDIKLPDVSHCNMREGKHTLIRETILHMKRGEPLKGQPRAIRTSSGCEAKPTRGLCERQNIIDRGDVQ